MKLKYYIKVKKSNVNVKHFGQTGQTIVFSSLDTDYQFFFHNPPVIQKVLFLVMSCKCTISTNVGSNPNICIHFINIVGKLNGQKYVTHKNGNSFL